MASGPGVRTVVLAGLLAIPASGCLPLLLGTARVLHPGDVSVSLAGMGRTSSLPAGVTQAGPAAGIAELRGGLPGGRVDTGITIQAPWNADWDLKFQLLRQDRWLPDLAVRADLGVIQPSFGASLLASRSAGPVTLTLMAGRDRRSERLWRKGSSPTSLESEHYVKDVVAWGIGAEYALTDSRTLFAGIVCWNPATASESPKTGKPFGVDEEPTYEFTAGIRLRWSISRPAQPAAALTTLRGYVIEIPEPDRLEVGQPGIYRATVLLDGNTRITAGGEPARREEVTAGRAVLIQGFSLPQPSTFLARTIELQ